MSKKRNILNKARHNSRVNRMVNNVPNKERKQARSVTDDLVAAGMPIINQQPSDKEGFTTVLLLTFGEELVDGGKLSVEIDRMSYANNALVLTGMIDEFIEKKDRVVTKLTDNLLKDTSDNNGSLVIAAPDIPSVGYIVDVFKPELAKVYQYCIVHFEYPKTLLSFKKRDDIKEMMSGSK